MDGFAAFRNQISSSSQESDDEQQQKRAKTERVPAAANAAKEQDGLRGGGSSSMPSSSGATEIVSSADDFPFPAFSPEACSSFVSSFSITNNSGAATAGSKQATEEPACLHGEDVDYIRDHCLVPSDKLKTFSADVIGNPQLAAFADQYEPVVSAAERAISGLLLFGPPGTGKSVGAQAVASKLGAKFYNFGVADLPNGKAGATRVNALFDVALADATPDSPVVIFIAECDTVLSHNFAEQPGDPAPAAKMPLEIITKEDGKEWILDPKDGIEYEAFTSNKAVSGYAGVAKVAKKDADKADKADKWRAIDKADKWRAIYKDKTVGTFDTMIEAILAHSKVATIDREAQKESESALLK